MIRQLELIATIDEANAVIDEALLLWRETDANGRKMIAHTIKMMGLAIREAAKELAESVTT